MTPQNQSLPARVLARGSRSRRAVQVGVAGVVVLSASIVLPTALAQSRYGDGAGIGAAETTTTVAPAVTALPTTTSTTSTTTAPAVEAPPAPVVEVAPPAPSPEDLLRQQLAVATPQELAAFNLYVMSDAERAAFAAYITPPPPAPDPAVVEELVPVEEPAPESGAEPPAVANGDTWDRLAQCEANGDWHINTGNGYSGGLQFHPTTWIASGGGAYASAAHLATREQQIAIAENVLAAAGGRFTPWPGCRAKLGLP